MKRSKIFKRMRGIFSRYSFWVTDPSGHCKEKNNNAKDDNAKYNIKYDLTVYESAPTVLDNTFGLLKDESEHLPNYLLKSIKNSIKPKNMDYKTWEKRLN